MENDNPKIGRIENIIKKIFKTSGFVLGASFFIAFVYSIICMVYADWRNIAGLIVGLIFIAMIAYLLSRATSKDEISLKNRAVKLISYFTALVMAGVCLIIAFAVLHELNRDVRARILYKKISHEELIKSIDENKKNIKTAIANIDSSVNTLSKSKDRIESLISQVKISRDVFSAQIDKMDELGETAKGLGDTRNEFEKSLATIKQITQGKAVLTLESFNKSQYLNIATGFFIGLFSAILANVLTIRFRRKVRRR